MLLSKQQQYVLDVLMRLGCVRKNQLEALLKARFFPPGKTVPAGFLEAMLRQFRCGDVEVRCLGDVIFLQGSQPNPRLLEAVDVMLELSGAAPSDFWAENKGAVLLRFSVAGRRVNLFAVLHASDLIDSDARSPPAVSRAERVVVLLAGDSLPPTLPIPNAVFYALRQKGGSHRFFAREGN